MEVELKTETQKRNKENEFEKGSVPGCVQISLKGSLEGCIGSIAYYSLFLCLNTPRTATFVQRRSRW